MVFWHCVCLSSVTFRHFIYECRPQDGVHSVEQGHTGTGDSAGTLYVLCMDHGNANRRVIFSGAVPQTPMNTEYVKKQAATFIKDQPGTTYVGLGIDGDVKEPI